MLRYDLFALGMLAAGGNLLGGVLITLKRLPAESRLQPLIGLGAGFLLAAVCLEIVPTAVQQAGDSPMRPMLILVAGYLTILAASHLIATHWHGPVPTAADSGEARGHFQRATAIRVAGALTLHTFFDGVTIASGAMVSLSLGVLLALAALMHKIPEGLTIACVLLNAGYPRRIAQGATLLIAFATMLGVISVLIFQPAIQSALPFAGGMALYVAASDLIPEISRGGGMRSRIAIVVGVGLFALTHALLHSVGLK